ncbi:MAG: extradiol dioxygenase [Chloroflexota bacterium]|nr:extradiol dioxygenase [Chloroflexota bacterium]
MAYESGDDMITGMHGIFFTPEAEAARAFVQEKLGLSSVDAGDGWLIFAAPKAELAFHPGDEARHDISFWCDDLEATMAELEDRGVVFTSPVVDQGFGLVTTFEFPGGVEVTLYEPRHPQPSQ